MIQPTRDHDVVPPLPDGGLRVIPLGGLGAIGRNMTLFEYGGKLGYGLHEHGFFGAFDRYGMHDGGAGAK